MNNHGRTVYNGIEKNNLRDLILCYKFLLRFIDTDQGFPNSCSAPDTDRYSSLSGGKLPRNFSQ